MDMECVEWMRRPMDDGWDGTDVTAGGTGLDLQRCLPYPDLFNGYNGTIFAYGQVRSCTSMFSYLTLCLLVGLSQWDMMIPLSL